MVAVWCLLVWFVDCLFDCFFVVCVICCFWVWFGVLIVMICMVALSGCWAGILWMVSGFWCLCSLGVCRFAVFGADLVNLCCWSGCVGLRLVFW